MLINGDGGMKRSEKSGYREDTWNDVMEKS